jgi:hypothetical protein
MPPSHSRNALLGLAGAAVSAVQSFLLAHYGLRVRRRATPE